MAEEDLSALRLWEGEAVELEVRRLLPVEEGEEVDVREAVPVGLPLLEGVAVEEAEGRALLREEETLGEPLTLDVGVRLALEVSERVMLGVPEALGHCETLGVLEPEGSPEAEGSGLRDSITVAVPQWLTAGLKLVVAVKLPGTATLVALLVALTVTVPVEEGDTVLESLQEADAATLALLK